MSRPVLALAAVAALVATCGAARAGSPDPVTARPMIDADGAPSVELRFDTALANTSAGQAALHRAIRHAARHVCDLVDGSYREMTSCDDEVIADANQQLAVAVARAEGRLYASAR